MMLKKIMIVSVFSLVLLAQQPLEVRAGFGESNDTPAEAKKTVEEVEALLSQGTENPYTIIVESTIMAPPEEVFRQTLIPRNWEAFSRLANVDSQKALTGLTPVTPVEDMDTAIQVGGVYTVFTDLPESITVTIFTKSLKSSIHTSHTAIYRNDETRVLQLENNMTEFAAGKTIRWVYVKAGESPGSSRLYSLAQFTTRAAAYLTPQTVREKIRVSFDSFVQGARLSMEAHMLGDAE